jgi:hypothetical protein
VTAELEDVQAERDDLQAEVDELSDELDQARADEVAGEPDTEDTSEGESQVITEVDEVVAKDPNPRGLLMGDAQPVLPAGEMGIVDVIQIGPIPTDAMLGSPVPVVVRNNTTKAVSRVEVSGAARSGGAIVSSGSSQGFSPTVLEPGEVGFGYVYFDDVIPVDSELALTASADEYDPDGFLNSVDLAVSEVNVVESGSGESVVGAVLNQTGVEVSGPYSVEVYCFDGDVLVDTRGGFADGPDPLPADQIVTFSVDLFDDPCPTFLVASSGYTS